MRKAPVNTINSAMNPLIPGSPSEHSPAMAKKKLVTPIRPNRPFSTLMSRICVLSYMAPTSANMRAVIMPCENICSTAPPMPMVSSVAIPIST